MFLECFSLHLSFVSRRDAATKSTVATGRRLPRQSVPILNLRIRMKMGGGWGFGIIFNEITIIWLYEVVNVIH